MKYKLLKDLPGIKAGEIISELQDTHPYSVQYKTVSGVFANAHPEFFEPIVEKKRYEDLKEGEKVFQISAFGKTVDLPYVKGVCRSETFLTPEEARDEHKRREYSVRPDRFIPTNGEDFFFPSKSGAIHLSRNGDNYESIFINLGLAFKTERECEKAIKEHDLINLFYKIR